MQFQTVVNLTSFKILQYAKYSLMDSLSQVLTKLSVPAQKEEYPLDLSPTDARIRKGVRRSSRLHAAASAGASAADPKLRREAPMR